MSEEEQVKITYEDFEEFYNDNEDLDNAEYYTEFPTVHKSTIRGWKVRAKKALHPEDTTIVQAPAPTSTQKREPKADLYDQEMVKLLCTQAGVPISDFAGVDTRSAILILKNKLAGQQAKASQSSGRQTNSNILPTPKPIGQDKTKYGIDDYIDFDLEKNEIRLEIPLDELMDPQKNEKLRKISS